jgi:hypothetical protein
VEIVPTREDVPDAEAPLIQIDMRFDGSMPAGVATGPLGARDFTGWVGLMSAVNALVGRGDDAPAGDGAP